MKDKVELKISSDGTIETIYQDGIEDFAKDVGGEIAQVCRLSNVEWEEIDGRKGWSVRAAHDTEIALRAQDWCRWEPSKTGTIILFPTRDEALAEEAKFVWGLMPPKEKSNG